MTKEVYAKFRLSIDNRFRNEFSFVHYRKWGIMELWEGGRFTTAPPKLTATAGIDIWLNWEMVATYKSYAEAQALVYRLLKTAPTSLHGLEEYLVIGT